MAGDYRYVPRDLDNGWLLVRGDGGKTFSLPYGVKLRLLDVAGGYENFEVLEGIHKGARAKVRSKSKSESFLLKNVMHRPGASVRFNLSEQAIWFGGRGPYNAFSGGGHRGFTPVAPGTYALALPAFPTSATRTAYERWTRFHRSWFRIGLDVSKDRFLHPGEISDGCVTVRQFLFDPATRDPVPPGFSDLPAGAGSEPGLLGLPLPPRRHPCIGWDLIYDYLILCRSGDQSVGTLVVV